MQFKVGYKTDMGCKRNQNQDNGACYPELGLFVVADGMGGHKGGEIASATAVKIILNFVRQAEQNTNWSPETVIVQAIESANQNIFQLASKDPSLQGMGTTATALLIKNQTLIIGHVGDSRCYFCKPTGIWQVTRDHSLVQEKLRAGLIQRKDLKTDRMKNVITRSVGFETDMQVETYRIDVQSGDTFLLCSDGLTGMLEDDEILKQIQKNLFEADQAQQAVNELIDAANAHGGDDNITALIVQFI